MYRFTESECRQILYWRAMLQSAKELQAWKITDKRSGSGFNAFALSPLGIAACTFACENPPAFNQFVKEGGRI